MSFGSTGGALGLRLADLDTEHGLVRLTEKGSTLRWQPITLDLAAHLDEHARTRGAMLPTDRLLRYRSGQAITSRPYDHLWNESASDGSGSPPKVCRPIGCGTRH
jgi:site-specific recombinase XerC